MSIPLAFEISPAIVKSPDKASAVKPPLIVDAPRLSEFESLIDTVPSDTTETLPIKLLSVLVSEISFVTAFKLVVPVIEIAPVCEIIPFATTFK